MSSSLFHIWGVGLPFAIFWNRRPDMRPVASKAVVNSHSPAAKLASIENPVAFIPQSVALFANFQGNWVRALTSLWRGRLAGKLERSGPFSARFPALVTSYEGPRAGFLNLVGAFKALRSLSSNALVKFCQEPTSRIFHGFQVSPGGFPFDAHLTPSAAPCGLVAVSDGHRDSERKIGNVRKSSGEIRNVIR